MRGLSNKKLGSRLEEMADQINLKEMWGRPVETLSKGFKRRVGIAQALIHDPDILILDEPTDGLDPNQKHEMRNLIRKISKNKAIVISTHILEEVEAVCSRAIIIANGKLLANDTPQNLENSSSSFLLYGPDADIQPLSKASIKNSLSVFLKKGSLTGINFLLMFVIECY